MKVGDSVRHKVLRADEIHLVKARLFGKVGKVLYINDGYCHVLFEPDTEHGSAWGVKEDELEVVNKGN